MPRKDSKRPAYLPHVLISLPRGGTAIVLEQLVEQRVPVSLRHHHGQILGSLFQHQLGQPEQVAGVVRDVNLVEKGSGFCLEDLLVEVSVALEQDDCTVPVLVALQGVLQWCQALSVPDVHLVRKDLPEVYF